MKFISTQNVNEKVDGARAVLNGIAPDGGLYVPESFPVLTMDEILGFQYLDYAERAANIISLFLPQYGSETIKNYAEKAYARFDGDAAPLVKIDEKLFMLELWHGPTHAFKDIALTILPHLLTGAKKLLGEKERTLILVATSGDTGKAALEGFKDVDGTDVIVFYPDDGVSEIQKLQMKTTTGANVSAAAIKGNFDDAQNLVKNLFADDNLKATLSSSGYKLSSANSINFGRLVPQIAYYFSSYADLLSGGQIKAWDKVNFCVPSGNFGNILAGFYALKMGLPINKLICASNKNNVLTDFINGGVYDREREFFKTQSPSMDILISSNLERLIFELSGRNDSLTRERIAALKTKGNYKLSDEELSELSKVFFAASCDEDETAETLFDIFDEHGYVCDTHTSVALKVYNDYLEKTEDTTETVVISTASPCKFAADVLKALDISAAKDEIKNLKILRAETGFEIPDSLIGLPKMEILHPSVIEKSDAEKFVLDYCNKK